MPWKEPGEKPREPRDRQPRDRDPWGRGSHGGGPDLEAWWRNGRRRLGPFGHGPLAAIAVIVVVVVLWFLIGGWTVIGQQQVGVVLRFGRLQAVLQPGFHLRFPSPVDRVQKVDLGQARTLSDATRLLTSDGQLAMVDYYVQYKVANVRDFLFATHAAEDTARNAALVVVRALVGTHTLTQLQQQDGETLGAGLAARLQQRLDADHLGMHIVTAGIQSVGVPSEVKPAFDDIAKAHADAKAAQATATADVARDKVEAEAQAAAIKASAVAYHKGAAAGAAADVARFDAVLVQYKAAPQVTRHQLWLQTMQAVLSRNHVVVNSGSGNVIVQFPAQPPSSAKPAPAASSSAPASAASITAGPAVSGAGA